MKIKLEDANIEEIEITIRGNIAHESVQNLIRILKENNLTSKISLFENSKEVFLDIKEIAYFEVIERKVYAKTKDKKYFCKHSLTEILDVFKNQGVTQIGKSILVNIDYVKYLEAEFSGNYIITLKNNEKLLVSRFYMKDFRKAILNKY